MENSGNSVQPQGKIVTNQVFLATLPNKCQLKYWALLVVANCRVTFCCDNLWKSKFMAVEKPGKLWEFFLVLCGYPVGHLTDSMWLVVGSADVKPAKRAGPKSQRAGPIEIKLLIQARLK